MKGHQFDLEFGVIEIDGKDLMDETEREEEAKKEIELQEAKAAKRIEEMEKKAVERIDKTVEEKLKKLEEVPDIAPDVSFEITYTDTPEGYRESKPYSVLDKTDGFIDEQIKDYRRHEKIWWFKFWVGMFFVSVVVGVLMLAFLAGHRIPVTQEFLQNAAKIIVYMIESIKNYFSDIKIIIG